MKNLKQLFGATLILSAIFVGILSTNVEAQCKEEVTFQFDDGALCDPQGNSCIVVWGCQ